MESAPRDVLDLLTIAIDDWDAQWEACHRQIVDTLIHAQESVEREAAARSEDGRVVSEEELERLRETLIEREDRLAEMEARNAELESQIAGLRETLDALLVERVQVAETSAVTRVAAAIEPLQEQEDGTGGSPFAEPAPAHIRAETEVSSQAAGGKEGGEDVSIPAAPHAFFEIPAFDDKGHKRRIGDILVDLGVVTRKQLKEMLSEQTRDPQRRLGALAVVHGYTDEELVARILAAQLQLPFIRLSEAEIDTAALNKVTPQIARSRKCVPLAVDGDCLRIAMANPLDLIAVEDIEISARLRVEPVVAMPGEIDAALRTFYGAH